MTIDPTRRRFLAGSLLALAGLGATRRGGCTLSIGTYSLKGIALEPAIDLVASLGYDGIEIAANPGFDGEPARMPSGRRNEIRKRLRDKGLKLTALMENLTPSAEAARHREDVSRLARVADLSRFLGDDPFPLIQTVLGPGAWDDKKTLYRDRLGDWLEITRGRGVVLAIKPHRSGAMSRPEEAIWLIRQHGDSPWLRMVHDYSHYAFRDIPLVASIATSLPYTAHVALKDAYRDGDRVMFDLPGARDTIDYPTLLRRFHDGGYRGDFCCEVSSQVSSRPGYDPTGAARTCYANMARAFARSGVPRG